MGQDQLHLRYRHDWIDALSEKQSQLVGICQGPWAQSILEEHWVLTWQVYSLHGSLDRS